MRIIISAIIICSPPCLVIYAQVSSCFGFFFSSSFLNEVLFGATLLMHFYLNFPFFYFFLTGGFFGPLELFQCSLEMKCNLYHVVHKGHFVAIPAIIATLCCIKLYYGVFKLLLVEKSLSQGSVEIDFYLHPG